MSDIPTCKRGHLKTPENLYRNRCRLCHKLMKKLWDKEHRKFEAYAPKIEMYEGELPQALARVPRGWYKHVIHLLKLNPDKILKITYPPKLNYQPSDSSVRLMLAPLGMKYIARWTVNRKAGLTLHIRVINK